MRDVLEEYTRILNGVANDTEFQVLNNENFNGFNSDHFMILSDETIELLRREKLIIASSYGGYTVTLGYRSESD